jgi:hypothetical protein
MNQTLKLAFYLFFQSWNLEPHHPHLVISPTNKFNLNKPSNPSSLVSPINFPFHYEKKGCFAIGFATQFFSCNGHLQFTIYIVQLIAIQLQLNQNNSFSTIIQLHYNYTHHVMLASLIIIHLLKYNMWHYEGF